jgi:hypothetical protein
MNQNEPATLLQRQTITLTIFEAHGNTNDYFFNFTAKIRALFRDTCFLVRQRKFPLTTL